MHLISALYGVIFKSNEEAAFSNYRLWESMGFLIAYLLQTKVAYDYRQAHQFVEDLILHNLTNCTMSFSTT